jgi:hypothetical protein
VLGPLGGLPRAIPNRVARRAAIAKPGEKLLLAEAERLTVNALPRQTAFRAAHEPKGAGGHLVIVEPRVSVVAQVAIVNLVRAQVAIVNLVADATPVGIVPRVAADQRLLVALRDHARQEAGVPQALNPALDKNPPTDRKKEATPTALSTTKIKR